MSINSGMSLLTTYNGCTVHIAHIYGLELVEAVTTDRQEFVSIQRGVIK